MFPRIFQSVLNGKFLGGGIEKPAAIQERLFSFFSELEDNQNIVVYSHSGMLQVIMKQMGIRELYMNNCGVLTFLADQNGLPVDMDGYWNKLHSG